MFPLLLLCSPGLHKGIQGTEAQVGAIQGQSPCPHPEPQSGVGGGVMPAVSTPSSGWLRPAETAQMGGPGGLEAGVPGAGVAVGQRTSCLDVAQHLLLVLLRPHLQGMGDELRKRTTAWEDQAWTPFIHGYPQPSPEPMIAQFLLAPSSSPTTNRQSCGNTMSPTANIGKLRPRSTKTSPGPQPPRHEIHPPSPHRIR